jgi:CrcB protein
LPYVNINAMLKTLLMVFLGGGAGSVARFGAARLAALWAVPTLPYATLGVNILGSFMIGFLWGWPAVASRPAWVHLLIVGFCGGFTTFSAFSWENLCLLRQGNITAFALYALGSVTVCLLGTWGGFMIGKTL